MASATLEEAVNCERNMSKTSNKMPEIIAKNWSQLLDTAALSLEPEEALAILRDSNQLFLDSLSSFPNDVDLLKLAIATPTLPLSKRALAARHLGKINPPFATLPFFLQLLKRWHSVGSSVHEGCRLMVHTALKNSLAESPVALSSAGPTDEIGAENTFIIYLQPRFFVTAVEDFAPNSNAQRIFEGIYNIILGNGHKLLPLVLPVTNILPVDDYANFPLVGQHTYGLRENVLHQKIAYLSDFSYLDASGFGPFSKQPDARSLQKYVETISIKVAEEFHSELKDRYINRRRSKFKQPDKELSLPPERTIYFFAMQTPFDTVARKAHLNQYDAIDAVLRHFKSSDRLLAIKRHPLDDTSKTQEFLERIKNDNNCILVDGNIHDLIQRTVATICVNSGVGIEALIHLKPVITLGKSDYALATNEAKTAEDLIDTIERINLRPRTPNEEFTKKFLAYFFKEHAVHVEDYSNISERLTKILPKKARN